MKTQNTSMRSRFVNPAALRYDFNRLSSDRSRTKSAQRIAKQQPLIPPSRSAQSERRHKKLLLEQQLATNPFIKGSKQPFSAPDFANIHNEDYLPAFCKGLAENKKEIQAIIQNPEKPTFENTIEPLSRGGKLMGDVAAVLFNLLSAHRTTALHKLAGKIESLSNDHAAATFTNAELFARVEAVYNQREKLDTEQRRLVESYYRTFADNGVSLPLQEQARVQAIDQRLSKLSLQFGDNVLKDTNSFEIWVIHKTDLDGIPADIVSGAAQRAGEKGRPDAWLFTAEPQSAKAVLRTAKNRELRRKVYEGYTTRGSRGNDNDNRAVVREIVQLRAERAHILGYESHAHYALKDRMAKTPEAANKLLQKMWDAAVVKTKQEKIELQKFADTLESQPTGLEPWDWSFYSELLRQKDYGFDNEALRPYLVLEKVRDAAFHLANRLYGLTFEPRADVAGYHPDVEAVDVKDANGKHLGLLYLDYYQRDEKASGAWMNNYREQQRVDGQGVRPIICNCCNFPQPRDGKPSLLDFSQVETLFHEFGHAIHGLVANTRYSELSGTNVARDFVEMPSQIMENWPGQPEFLKPFAHHYQTGEAIPDELIAKMERADKFNKGAETLAYLTSAIIDMRWHSLQHGQIANDLDPIAFEQKVLEEIGHVREVMPYHLSTHFKHLFSGGYSAGYYSYLWSEMLDADAFVPFKENGLYHQPTAKKLFTCLSSGASEDEMALYVALRGREPTPDALMARRGFT